MASTLFGGSGGAIYIKKGLARAVVHIILARIVVSHINCCIVILHETIRILRNKYLSISEAKI